MTMLEKNNKTNEEIEALEKAIIYIESNENYFDRDKNKINQNNRREKISIEGDDAWCFIHKAFSHLDKKYLSSRTREDIFNLINEALKRCVSNDSSKIYHYTFMPGLPLSGGFDSESSICFDIGKKIRFYK